MLRLDSMAMQQSSKGASGSGPNPALSDEQADQFAASFTPAWDTGEADASKGEAEAPVMPTVVIAEAAPPAPTPEPPPAPPIVGSPAIMLNPKATMIGVAPPPALALGPEVRAAASSAEAIDPENVLEVVTAPPANVAPPAPAPAAPHANANPMMRTQLMDNRPARQAPSVPPPSPNGGNNTGVRSDAPPPRVAIAADPFKMRPRGQSSSDDLDLVPKRSSKTFFFVIAGLAVAAGLGLFLKFALTDDAPKAPPTQLVTGPAVTTAEIPPPPPKAENAPAPTTSAVTAAKTAEPGPVPLAIPLAIPPSRATPEPAPPRLAAAPPAPRNEPRQPRGTSLPPPPAAAVAPPPPPASPKTPPKPPNGGIVRDNPF